MLGGDNCCFASINKYQNGDEINWNLNWKTKLFFENSSGKIIEIIISTLAYNTTFDTLKSSTFKTKHYKLDE